MTFETTKAPNEIIDYSISYAAIFAEDTPIDQISTSAWEVTKGDVVLDSDRIDDTDKAVGRVSGGTKWNSYHEVKNTIVCISGQKYTRTIRIQIKRK